MLHHIQFWDMSGSYQDWIVLTLELRLNSYKTRLTKRDINCLSRKMLRGGCKAGWFLFSELVSLLVFFLLAFIFYQYFRWTFALVQRMRIKRVESVIFTISWYHLLICNETDHDQLWSHFVSFGYLPFISARGTFAKDCRINNSREAGKETNALPFRSELT